VSELRELVVCSLEAWDDVWRRNQFFADALLRREPRLRVLFVEPPTDPLHALAGRRRPSAPRLRRVTADGRLRALRPLKPLPRRAGALADRALLLQVTAVARLVGLARPTLWLNDLTYAPLIGARGWPTVYDVTDDWLQAPAAAREHDRLRALEQVALAAAAEVVVCSPGLARSRGAGRDVTLIPNAVDAEHFRRPRPRPADLPPGPVAVYVGSLHDARLDVELVAELARSLPVVLVGPDSLEPPARAALDRAGVVRLGPRPYDDVPAYLQHADVVVVPHRVNAFTESLDPIKAYECLAVATPTVATPVAGFRELAGSITVAEPAAFVDAVRAARGAGRREHAAPVPSWAERAEAFAAVLERATAR
jgi:glycosyltransferase involved in cell wall biosynthesis